MRPLWAFIAGLRALGFDRKVLQAALDLPSQFGGKDQKQLAERLLHSAMTASAAGYVLIVRSDGTSVAETVDFLRQNLAQKDIVPALALPERDLRHYDKALEWLATQGAVTRLIYEEDD